VTRESVDEIACGFGGNQDAYVFGDALLSGYSLAIGPLDHAIGQPSRNSGGRRARCFAHPGPQQQGFRRRPPGPSVTEGLGPRARRPLLGSIVIGLASTGAALNGLASHANHAGHAERFSDVAYELEQERKEVEASVTLSELRRSAGAVRRIMLGETNAWFEGMSSSEIEVPT
jgi:hypothetical protein